MESRGLGGDLEGPFDEQHFPRSLGAGRCRGGCGVVRWFGLLSGPLRGGAYIWGRVIVSGYSTTEDSYIVRWREDLQDRE